MATRTRPTKPAQTPEDPEFVSPTREEEPPAEPFEGVDLVKEAERIFEGTAVDFGPPQGLHRKLAQIRAEFGFVGKTGRNTGVGGGYGFVEATEVSRRFVELAGKYGLTMLPVSMDIADIRDSSSGKQQVFTIKSSWQITDSESGEVIHVDSFGQGADSADKALPKAQTNAMKYAILLVLQAAGDDPENDPRTDALEHTPQGPGVNVGPSNIEGVRQGGRQTKITQPQLDEIRRHARRLEMSPEELATTVGAALGGKTVDLDGLEETNEQQQKVITFMAELSFDEGGKVIQHLASVEPGPANLGDTTY